MIPNTNVIFTHYVLSKLDLNECASLSGSQSKKKYRKNNCDVSYKNIKKKFKKISDIEHKKIIFIW